LQPFRDLGASDPPNLKCDRDTSRSGLPSRVESSDTPQRYSRSDSFCAWHPTTPALVDRINRTIA
jgi:hypothetical protein